MSNLKLSQEDLSLIAKVGYETRAAAEEVAASRNYVAGSLMEASKPEINALQHLPKEVIFAVLENMVEGYFKVRKAETLKQLRSLVLGEEAE